MDLRPELMPPSLDAVRVRRLTDLASRLDGCRNDLEDCEALLREFNREAGTSLEFRVFQGIYGGTDHETWVRELLAAPTAKQIRSLTYEELLELVTRVRDGAGEEHAILFWIKLLEANLPDPRISDLIFWPDYYFGDAYDGRELTSKEILDIALAVRPPAPIALPPPVDPPS